MASAGDALGWLDAERTASIAMLVQLKDARWRSQLGQLGQILSMSLRFGSRGADTLTVNRRLLEIARAEDDRLLEAAAWDSLAWGSTSCTNTARRWSTLSAPLRSTGRSATASASVRPSTA